MFTVIAPGALMGCALSLHDALPIWIGEERERGRRTFPVERRVQGALEIARHEEDERALNAQDRKSTRLNSSHRCISYAVFCLKKKKPLDILSSPPCPITLSFPVVLF